MSYRHEYSVIIPAYNEEERLQAPLLETLDYLRAESESFEIVVVDDGSSDGTAELVNRLGRRHSELRLIRLPTNRGKGYAVRTGVVNSYGDYVLFADADGSTPIRELSALRKELEDGADVAIGSRAMPDGDGSGRIDAKLHRKIIGRLFHACVALLTVGDFHDTQCGFKLFRGDVARELFSRLEMDGFSFDVELLSMARYCGYRVHEVPVEWTHVDGSRVNLLSDSLRMLRDLTVIRARLMREAYEDHNADSATDGREDSEVKISEAM